jgi:cytochrome P450
MGGQGKQRVVYDPFASEVQADPYPFYASLRDHAPVYFVDSLDAYAISRYADVRRVMREHVTFSSEAMAELVARPVNAAGNVAFDAPIDSSISIIGRDGEDHTRLRTIANRGFTPPRIAELEHDMRRIVQPFLEGMVAKGGGDLMADFAVPFPTTVIAAMLGVDRARIADFRRWSEDMILAVFEPMNAEQTAAVAQSAGEMSEYLDGVFEARAANPTGDLVSLLVAAEAEGGALTREELGVFAFTLLVAGSITTAYLIGNSVMQLVENPALLAAVREDLDLVEPLIEESLRFEAPTQLMFRTATVPVEIAGTAIPQGATLVALLGAANRDGRAFPDADTFDITRTGGAEHIAFGQGAHHCLGAALARIEARIAIGELLRTGVPLEPAGPMQRVTSVAFRGPITMPLRFA